MTRQTVLVKGNRLAVWREGSGSPVVLVHGWLCDHQDLVSLGALLAVDHEVVLIDLHGHGESEGTHGGYTMPDFGTDVVGVIEALDLGPVLLIGHSMGAAVVLEAARLAPEAVRGVLLIDSRWAFTSATPEQIESIPTLLGEAYVPRRAAMDELRRTAQPDVVIGAPTQAVAAASYEGLLTWPGQRTLRECTAPVYAVVADQHWPLIPAAQADVPALTAELITGTGHWVQVEQPERVAESVRRFEAGLSWSAPAFEALDPATTVAIVVDMQWPYFDPSSPLAIDGGADLVARTAAFTRGVRSAGARVMYTATLIRPGVPIGRTTKRFPFKEQNRATWAELTAGIESADGDVVIHKPRHSAFFGTDLDSVLRSLDCQNVVVSGITSNVCCFATALDAAARDYTVYWVDDLIAALPISRPGFEIDAVTAHRNTSAMVAYSVGTVCTAEQVLTALGA